VVSTLKLTKIQTPNSDSDVMSLDASSGNVTFHKPVTGTALQKISSGTAATGVGSLDIDLPTDSYWDKFVLVLKGVGGMGTAGGGHLIAQLRTSGGSVRTTGGQTSGDYYYYHKTEQHGSAWTGDEQDDSNGIRITYYHLPDADAAAHAKNYFEIEIVHSNITTAGTKIEFKGYGFSEYSNSLYGIWRQGHGGLATALEVNDLIRIKGTDGAQTADNTFTHEGYTLYGWRND